MAVTDNNGEGLLRFPVQELGESQGEGGLDVEDSAGCAQPSSARPPVTDPPEHPEIHPAGPGNERLPDQGGLGGEGTSTPAAMDSEAGRGSGAELGALASPTLDSKESPFPAVVGNRPVNPGRRYPAPIPLAPEADIDAERIPERVTTAWIRGQVDEADWAQHWKFGGRITPAMIKEFYDGVSNGYSLAAVQRRQGLSSTTWYEWKERAAKGSRIHMLFVKLVDSALGNIEVKVVDAWVSKVPEDWRAAENFLKVRFPQDWNPSHKVEVSGNVHHEHEAKLSLSDADLLSVADILRTTGVLDTDTPAGVIDAEVIDDDGTPATG